MIEILTMILYFVRMLVLGLATGTIFLKLGLFKKLTDGQTMIIGVASAPMVVSLADYLLGLIFIGWGSWFYSLMPILLAMIYIFMKRNYLTTIEACKSICRYCIDYVRKIGFWFICDMFIAIGVTLFFLLIYNRINPKVYISEIYHSLNVAGLLTAGLWGCICAAGVIVLILRMIKDGTFQRNAYLTILLIVIGTATAHALSMTGRPRIDSDRAHYELDARYFLEDKNSWEVDNYTDERYGSSMPDDHGPLWIMYLADAYIVADTAGLEDPLRCVNIAIFWVYLCFIIFLFMLASYGGGTYRAGVLSLVLFHIYIPSILMVTGSRDAFRFASLMLLIVFVLNQIETIIMGGGRWFEYAAMFLFCYLSMNGHEGNVYIMLGMFIVVGILLLVMKTPIKHLMSCGISVLLGTLLGITKTLSIYLTTGRMKSWSLLPFHDTPVIEQIAAVNSDRADRSTIWSTYTWPVRFMMLLGIIGLILMIIRAWREKNKKDLFFPLMVIGMLLPMTGIMDWIGWEVSLWFAEQLRYRMYFLMLFAVTGSWLLTRKYNIKIMAGMSFAVCTVMFMFFICAEGTRCNTYNKAYVATCINNRHEYEKMADIISSVTDGDVFTHDQVLLFYLNGTPKLLYHPYAEDLIQAKTNEEIAAAIEKLNIGAILLPENGLDYHDYSLLPFWNYINDQNYFSQITPEEGEYASNKIIFYKNR